MGGGLPHPLFIQMKIIATIIFFNDEPELLLKALESVKGADQIVLVDGPYADWPHGGKLKSDNALIDLMRNWGFKNKSLKIINSPTIPFPHQINKRNEYLIGNEGDWYINIDADEELRFHGGMDFASLKAMLQSLPKNIAWLECNLVFRPDMENGLYPTGRRIFKHLKGIHYAETHAKLWDGDGNRTALEQGEKTTGPNDGIRSLGLDIYHNKIHRSKERLHLQGQYYTTREHP